jgi:uncharacterized protein (UPF0332 family)
VTPEEARREVITYWVRKTHAALDSADAELGAGRADFAVNRAYYAAFYAASALLLRDGHRFVKHSAVRSALHRHYVKTGIVKPEWGRIFDRLLDSRQRGDYQELVEFDPEEAAQLLRDARAFTQAVLDLLLKPGRPAPQGNDR